MVVNHLPDDIVIVQEDFGPDIVCTRCDVTLCSVDIGAVFSVLVSVVDDHIAGKWEGEPRGTGGDDYPNKAFAEGVAGTWTDNQTAMTSRRRGMRPNG